MAPCRAVVLTKADATGPNLAFFWAEIKRNTGKKGKIWHEVAGVKMTIYFGLKALLGWPCFWLVLAS
jgi:hypothetical protein